MASTRSGTVDLYAPAAPGYATAPYQTLGPAVGSYYGIGIAFSTDGATLLVGDPLGGSGGIVYAYSRATGMTFETAPDQTFGPPVGMGGGRFGAAIAFTPDGTAVLVGDDVRMGGVVYTYPFAGAVTTTPSAITSPASTITLIVSPRQ